MKIFKEKGYTVLELMSVIAIVGILVALAVPSFSNVTKKNTITATTNELAGLLQYAKTMAVAHNNPVIVCPYTKTGTTYTCEDDFASGGNLGVFLYAATKSDDQFLRGMSIAKSIVITNKSVTGGKAIAFYPDSSSAIHGIPASFSQYNVNGAYESDTLTLTATDFPTGAGIIKWQISTKTSATYDTCNIIQVSAIGLSKITQGDCE